jgi:formylglycine-generating enzyme
LLLPEVCNEAGAWQAAGDACSDGCALGKCAAPPSCDDVAPCTGGVSCCEARSLPGGPLSLRSASSDDAIDSVTPRAVSSFILERFEVTASRFANFVNAYAKEILPAEGRGAHPNIPNSGWVGTWNDNPLLLPQTKQALVYGLQSCGQPWPLLEEDGELPIRCVNWYLAFAFCIWDDDGRLPTEAEWAFAAQGGPEDRYYPWSTNGDQSIAAEQAAYADGEPYRRKPDAVGLHPQGASRFGHEDLAGNVWEWTADWYLKELSDLECREAPGGPRGLDCLEQRPTQLRVQKGGSYVNNAEWLVNAYRAGEDPTQRNDVYGFRCVRKQP